MLNRSKFLPFALSTLLVWCIQGHALAQSQPCPRPPAGSTVKEPVDLVSKNGLLQLGFAYQTRTDEYGNKLYCFMTPAGAQSPTLRVQPGDRIQITLQNALPPSAVPSSSMLGMSMGAPDASSCSAGTMTSTSVNIHYHGTNTPPVCHQDEVIHTTINAGETFEYTLQIPKDEPPGLYWYHPHIHGMAEAAVQGGATGALIVGGIENVNPAVAGLPQQVLIVRDNPLVNQSSEGGTAPTWDLSLNYVPVAWPNYTPAVIQMKPVAKQFWRVLNAAADSVLDLQVRYDNAPQTLQVVALDGVPTGSQDGTGTGKTITMTHILVPPAGRAEFIVTGPASTVQSAQLVTLNVPNGPDGPSDPSRPLASIVTSASAADPGVVTPPASGPPPAERFAGLANTTPVTQRKLYFSEDANGFYITVDGQTPTPFNPDNPPAITTTQGSVEDWTIENRSLENHDFHIHQIHFLVLERNGVAVAPSGAQFLDTIQVPYWSGQGPYPSVKLRMDFRGKITGDFVYHCHILVHEDYGMMAIIRVNPPSSTQGQ